MIEILRIPEERKAVLIGPGGRARENIEKRTGVKIEVGDAVEVSGEDPIVVMRVLEIVKAIGRGFSPKHALRLLQEDYELRVVSLEGEGDKTRKRLFGRVIGRAGGTREKIERETGALISIYGKTVSLIGTPDEVEPAEDAVRELLSGKTHAWAYRRMTVRKANG